MAKTDPTEEQITKRKVTLVNSDFVGVDTEGRDLFARSEIVDYVREDFLAAYVAAASAPDPATGVPRWRSVTVEDGYDAGPGGYHGQTYVPHGLEHELAGQTFPATEPERKGGGGKVATFLTGDLGTFMIVQAALVGLLLSLAALIQTVARKNTLATSYATDSTSCALYSTTPTSTAGTELTGGSPPYARITPAWGSASGGVVSTSAMTFNVPSGSTVAGFGLYNAGAVYQDGAGLTSQAFASQGTYALTVTYTQT